MISKPFISVVIPIFNEEGNIARLDAELKTVLPSISSTFEIIYINDGSTDDSLKELQDIYEKAKKQYAFKI